MTSYIYLLLSVAFGALVGVGLKSHKKISVKYLLTFSGAYLLSIGIFHLLPEIFDGHNHHMGLWIMAGFFIQLVLEVFSKGLEHGHGHTEWFRKKGVPVAILVSLFLHALLESLPVGAHHDHAGSNALLWGIVVHKLPVSIILISMLIEVTSRWWRILFIMVLFALMAPMGVLLGQYVPGLQDYYRQLAALSFGLFLHISTTILFESNQTHRFNFMKFATILLAVAIAWFSAAYG